MEMGESRARMKDPDGDIPGQPPAKSTRARGPVAVAAYRAVGALAMLLAAAGVVLPGLPTTPFLLVALWAFTRGAPEWADRLRAHPRYGQLLRNWEERQAIPRAAKGAAVVGVTASWGVLAFTTHNLLLASGVGVVMLAVLIYVVSRPHE